MTADRLARPALVVALLALLTLPLAACSTTAHASGIPMPGDSIGQPLNSTVPEAIRSMPLVSSDGSPLSLAALAGKVVVVSDMMTLCQETCPIDTATTVAVARAVERAGLGDRVAFLSITIDPGRDDRRHLADPPATEL
jgi:cytochrome oxidase Cu insertion factor (SCO1/SenC/PrrC family)